jgi:hypothetical protein
MVYRAITALERVLPLRSLLRAGSCNPVSAFLNLSRNEITRRDVFEDRTNDEIKTTRFPGYTFKSTVSFDCKSIDTTCERFLETATFARTAEDKPFIFITRPCVREKKTISKNILFYLKNIKNHATSTLI